MTRENRQAGDARRDADACRRCSGPTGGAVSGEAPPAGVVGETHPLLASAEQQLQEYFAGERQTFELPLDPVGTPFQRRYWLALSSIPYGTTISYGEQARRLKHPRAARAVGAANARNPIPIVLPCHRVVGADGALTGYGGGLDAKRLLLEHETHVLDGTRLTAHRGRPLSR